MADYIEKQAAKEKLCGMCRWEGTSNCDECEHPIDDIPPADVRPVRRGRWEQTGGKYSRHKTIDRRILTCSVCGNFLYMEGVNAGRGDANFCPNCGSYNGADMRGGDAE